MTSPAVQPTTATAARAKAATALHGAGERPACSTLAAARLILDAAPAGIERAADRAQLGGAARHVLATAAGLGDLVERGDAAVRRIARKLAVQSQLTAADALFGLGMATQAAYALQAARRAAVDVDDAVDRDDLLNTALRIEGKMYAYAPLGPAPAAFLECDPQQAKTPAQVAVAFQAARACAHFWSPIQLQAHVGYALDAAERLPHERRTGVYLDRFSFTNALYHAHVVWSWCGAATLAERHYRELVDGMADHRSSVAVVEYTMGRMYFRRGQLEQGLEHVRRGQQLDTGHQACQKALVGARNAAFTHRDVAALRDFLYESHMRAGLRMTAPASAQARAASGAPRRNADPLGCQN
jgi:hypothetical protein